MYACFCLFLSSAVVFLDMDHWSDANKWMNELSTQSGHISLKNSACPIKIEADLLGDIHVATSKFHNSYVPATRSKGLNRSPRVQKIRARWGYQSRRGGSNSRINYYRYKNKPAEIYLGTTRVPHGMGTPGGIPEGPRGQNPPGSRWVSRVGPTWCPVWDPLGSLAVVFAGK